MTEPFPFAMVQVSLDALLDSLTPEALWRLIDAEGVRDARGFPLIGHVIAGNTPLLAWVSVLRALLVRSASLVKLPSGQAANGAVVPCLPGGRLAGTGVGIDLRQWPGGDDGA